ncbi:MAG: replicative DNA helicase [Candidatus Nanopelagicales bacterium]
MSVAELPVPYDEGPPSDRTPPQDVAAEQSVLGAMMLSKDAIADVVEDLREGDFYRPAHATIYSAVLDIYGRGDPADAVTVAAELTRTGEISRIGGASYLHTLVSLVPTAANAGYYARIVKERAILRRLVEAGTRIVQMGYAGEGDVDNVVDRAQAEVYEVTERRSAEDYLPLRDLMDGALTEIEAIANRGGQMVGVPTGFADLDSLTNGLHPGQFIIIAARPAIGKALALDTPLPTPTGWTTMGDVRPGDQVLDEQGLPTTVLAVSETWTHRPCYQVTFADGSTIIADAEHEWLTETRGSRKSAQAAATGYNRYRHQQTFAAVRTTREIAETLRCPTKDARLNHSVVNARPLSLPAADLPLPPYTLGVWLGDGTSLAGHFTSADPEIAMLVEADGLDAPVPALLRGLGVWGNKYIPAPYLRASEDQRRALLAGLLDTDGTVTSNGNVQLTTTSRSLAEGAFELVVSLGYRCSISTKRVKGRSEESSIAYNLNFTTLDEVFRLPRKALLHKERMAGKSEARSVSRFITRVDPVPSVPVRCIQVSNDSHLYLAGRAMIPTHNSTLAVDIARSASIKHGLASVIFSLEMGRNEILMRLLSAEAQVALHHMRSGNMSDNDWTKLAGKMGAVSEAPLFIDDSPNLTMMEIRAKCRRLKQRHDLRLVVVDYMQLMTSGKKVESRQQEVSEFSRSLKLLAKELEVPVIAVSQLNRGPEQRQDKRPMLSDLRESGSLEQDADVVLLLHREDAYERESPRAGEADFIIAKHRNGPTQTITVAFQGHYSRFVDMAQ